MRNFLYAGLFGAPRELMAFEVSDRMPGSKFDQVLKLKNGRISPEGDLDIGNDEEIIRLFVWVIQIHDDGTSAACIGFQEAGGFQLAEMRWDVRTDAIHEGVFRPGQGLAMAVSISKVVSGVEPSPVWHSFGTPEDGSTRVYWWSETVVIAPAA